MALLRQEIGFFDQQDTASGALALVITSHPSNVGAVSGLVLSQIMLSMKNFLGSLILSLVLSWKTNLVCFVQIVVLSLSTFDEVTMLKKYKSAASESVATAFTYINDATDTIRTVSAQVEEKS